jgi:hypothetical protein
MRRWLPLLCMLLLWPVAALAAPTVQQLVEKAVDALDSTSYEGRMRFLSQFEHGQELTVAIAHVAPDLYRVTPLVSGKPGDLYYIENAAELLRVTPSQGTVVSLPIRQFALSDALTVKFLRDLGTHSGTVVLDGTVGKYPVYALRQDAQKDKPYTITVGLDKQNYMPIFLLVTDGEGARRVYYEMESIDYRQHTEIADANFIAPAASSQPAPKQRSSVPALQLPNGPLPPSTEASRDDTGNGSLPLYPGWLPEGYRLEGVTLLNYAPEGQQPVLVYQFEIFGPRLDDMISVFQTSSEGMDFGKDCNEPDCGYYVEQRGPWFIAVLGSQQLKVLQRIADQLAADDAQLLPLLQQTMARDRIWQQALNNSW